MCLQRTPASGGKVSMGSSLPLIENVRPGIFDRRILILTVSSVTGEYKEWGCPELRAGHLKLG